MLVTRLKTEDSCCSCTSPRSKPRPAVTVCYGSFFCCSSWCFFIFANQIIPIVLKEGFCTFQLTRLFQNYYIVIKHKSCSRSLTPLYRARFISMIPHLQYSQNEIVCGLQCHYYLFKTVYHQGVIFPHYLGDFVGNDPPTLHPRCTTPRGGTRFCLRISTETRNTSLRHRNEIKQNPLSPARRQYRAQKMKRCLRLALVPCLKKSSSNAHQYFEDTVEFNEATSHICMHGPLCPTPPNWVFTSSNPIEGRRVALTDVYCT